MPGPVSVQEPQSLQICSSPRGEQAACRYTAVRGHISDNREICAQATVTCVKGLCRCLLSFHDNTVVRGASVCLFPFHLETHLEHAELGVFHFPVVPPSNLGPGIPTTQTMPVGGHARQAPPGFGQREALVGKQAGWDWALAWLLPSTGPSAPAK